MRSYRALVPLLLLLASLFPSQLWAKEKLKAADYAKITLETDGFNPASRCGLCHIDIYTMWKESQHAKSFSDPAFRATFLDPRVQNDEAVKSRCLQCHAPTLHYDRRLNLKSGVATEGVTCDFCHSVQDLNPKDPAKPFAVAAGKLKRGPFRDSKSPVHETRHAEFFQSGALCGGCHEMSNAHGVPIISTFSEWKEGYFNKIATASCQDCHMPLAAGLSVSPKHQEMKRRINLHSFPGGHSRAQLLDALEIKVLDSSHANGRMQVKLGLANVGAGHHIPTGNPLRKVIVDFNAYGVTNNLLHSEQVELSRKFVDKSGRRLATDVEILLDATRVADDNRIPPGGTKVLNFAFAAPNEKTLVDVKVSYLYKNEAFPKLARQEKLISFTQVLNKPKPDRPVEEPQPITTATGYKAEKIDFSKMALDRNTFNPAPRCGRCHVDIYGLWKESMHSKALSDPAFRATFMDPTIQKDARLKQRCLQCHAPAHYYNPKVSLDSEVASEGVTCDFCHSIQELNAQNPAKPFSVAWGNVKRGPFKDAISPAHETRHSALFESADLCGSCHEMTNAKGLPIITTYSEWKETKNAGGSTCQECHMPLGAGVSVFNDVQKTIRRINLHTFPGGHSRAQLLEALDIKILDATRNYGKMTVKLGLTNAGAGHYIPTGNPLRKVTVDFSVYSSTNKRIHHEQVELSRKFTDGAGKPLRTDLDILTKATAVAEDSRIAPGETRTLTFEFMAPDEKLLVDARVTYKYQNDAHPKLSREEKLITFTKVINKLPLNRLVDDVKAMRDEPRNPTIR
ncbi:MAG: hypothetical protein HY900_13705 [Deltaproteobacteria bacterium]|nr:hypothetical protein [Deltaproteobacteria bacterium]